MSDDWGRPNPYASPSFSSPFERPDLRQVVRGRVTAPAVALIVVGILGAAASIFNVVFAFVGVVHVDPQAPELVQGFQQGAVGPMAAVIQTVFLCVNLLIIVGAVQMLRFRGWGLAIAASILAMLNFGTCCCILGIPVGIWSLATLLMPDVKAAFLTTA